MNCSTPGLPVLHQLRSSLKLMSIESVMPSNHLILYQPFLLLPSIFLRIRVFSKELALGIRWSKYWRFIFGISPSNEYAEYIMWNSRLDESQAGIKIARRNINNLRYPDDNTVMTESKEELRSLLMRVKEESEKAGLKCNIQKTKVIASSPITSWQIDGERMETLKDCFLGLQNHCRWWLQPWN